VLLFPASLSFDQSCLAHLHLNTSIIIKKAGEGWEPLGKAVKVKGKG